MSINKRPDGLEDYILGKDSGLHKAGDTIPVDPERRDWLNTNGYRNRAPKPPDAVDSVISVIADAAVSQRFVDPELRHPPFTDKEI